MKTDIVYLCHIVDSIEKIESYARVQKEEFLSVSHWQDAIITQKGDGLIFQTRDTSDTLGHLPRA